MRPYIVHSRRRQFIPPQPSRLVYVDHLEKRGVDLGRLETELRGHCCELEGRSLLQPYKARH